MKQIVIISKQGRVNHELITALTTLFPECDINVAAADRQGREPFPAGSFSEMAHIMRINDNKNEFQGIKYFVIVYGSDNPER